MLCNIYKIYRFQGDHLAMDKLKPNTYYEVRVYAASAAGEGLGVNIEFTTPPPSTWAYEY